MAVLAVEGVVPLDRRARRGSGLIAIGGLGGILHGLLQPGALLLVGRAAKALASSGGLMDTVQAQQIRDAAGHEDPADRMAAISGLMSEEARLGMLVGVAVGWELARELELSRGGDGPDPDND